MDTPLTAPCVYCGDDRPIEAELCPTCGRGWIDARIESRPSSGPVAPDDAAGEDGSVAVAAGAASGDTPSAESASGAEEQVRETDTEQAPPADDDATADLSAETPEIPAQPQQLGFADEHAETAEGTEIVAGTAAVAGAAAVASAAIPRVAGDEPPDMAPEPVELVDVYGDLYADEALPVDDPGAVTAAVVGATPPAPQESAGEPAARIETTAEPAEGMEAVAEAATPEGREAQPVAAEPDATDAGEDDLGGPEREATEAAAPEVGAEPTPTAEDATATADAAAPDEATAADEAAAAEEEAAAAEEEATAPDEAAVAAPAEGALPAGTSADGEDTATIEPGELEARAPDEKPDEVSGEAAAAAAATSAGTAAVAADTGFETTTRPAAATVPSPSADEGDALADALSPLPMEEPRGRRVQTLVVLGVVAAVIIGWFFVLALISRGGDGDIGAQPPPSTLPTETVPATATPETPTTTVDAPTTTAAVTTTDAATTTSAAPPTIPQFEAVGEPLAAADLGLGGFALGPFAFGSSEALGRLVATYGQPDGFTALSTEWGTCDGDQGFVTTWGPLSTIFLGSVDAPELAGYRLGTDGDHPATDLRTLSGLQVGDTVAELESIYRRFSVDLQEVDGQPSFILTRDTDNATLLWGPVTSIEADGVVEGIYSPRPCDQGPVPAP